MTLSNDLISQFVKVTNDDVTTKKETIVYGTAVKRDGLTYVKIDGSDLLTPASSTVNIPDVEEGERVTVMIKNHSAVISGSLKTQAATTLDVSEVRNIAVGYITADHAVIKNLQAGVAKIDTLESTMITTEHAVIKNLQADVADIDTLIFGSATGTTIQTSFANAVIAQLGNAQIKSAMIKDISASKITAGDIITNNVRIKSEDGSLIISDETIQISDDTRVRVQIGKDASNDYSINIWDADGELMFSQGGITDKAIKEAIIRNDMISETANISASKLDIDSLFEEINKDGSNTIKSTRVYLDENKQTLDLAFKGLTTDVNDLGEIVSSQGTQISAIQGQISSKIWQQDINTAKNEMSTQYSTLEQEVDGFKTTVSETYATKNDVEDIEVGGRNLILNSSFATDSSKWSYNAANAFTHLPNGGYSGDGALQLTITTPSTVAPRQNTSFSFAAGTALTCSVKVKEIEGSWGTESYARWANLYSIFYSYHESLNDGWTLYVYKAVLTEDLITTSTNVFGFAGIGNGTFIIDEIKLEKGNKATDWTPAPEDIETRVASAESSITQLSNKITSNVTETTNLGTRMSTVEQTASGLTTRLSTAETNINTAKTNAATAQTTANNAAKTATNYLNFSNGGLTVGDMTASTLGKNVLIDSDSVDIRNGTTTLASFGAKNVVLGRNAEDSVIDLCNGAGKISANTASAATSYPNRNAILIESQEIETESVRFVASTSNKYGASSTPSIVRGTEVYMQRSTSTTGESCARLKAEHKTTSSGAYTNAGISAMTYDSASTTRAMVYASDSANSANNQVNVYPTKTTMNKNLVLNGTTFTGKNKVLWTGAYYLSDSQTATLSEAISAQANGVVLVWSEYVNGEASNSNFNMTYIPKHFITLQAGKGVNTIISNGSMNIIATKYAYVSDTSIKGYAGNDDAATAKDSGVTSTSNRFVLRYVIGV